MFTLKVRNS